VAFDERQTEWDARDIRKRQGIEGSIPDIFNLILNENCYWIRHPFGKNTLCGCAILFENTPVIVTNSSEIRAREYFTAAHELAHVRYDLQSGISGVIVDKEIQIESVKGDSEKRANRFAANLLLPKEDIVLFIRRSLRKNGKELTAWDIVRIQIAFKASYDFILYRLKEVRAINEAKRLNLKEIQTQVTSDKLFATLGEDPNLIRPFDQIRVPPQFLQWARENYELNRIPYEGLKHAFDLIKIDAEPLRRTIEASSAEASL
jgi:Zn-dependent peptidase ImmA (M78 family)